MRKQTLHPRTAIINKQQKNRSKKSRTEALTWLTKKFPSVFDNSLSIQPLKIGIMKDILLYAEDAAKAGISKSKLREAVVIFTRRLDYLACLKARDNRIDLEGNLMEPVAEEEAIRAATKIKKRVEKCIKNTRSTSDDSQSDHKIYSQDKKMRLPLDENLASARKENTASDAPRMTSVLIKHKATRAYDPEAVARLREKLGLSTASELKESHAD